MSIELHCHTEFSVDGYGTPEVLVEAAAACGVETLAITEHNHLGSTERAAARAEALGIRYLPGIELDSAFDGHGCHLLGLGVDPAHAGLQAVAQANHACYAARFERHFGILRELGFPWTREQLLEGLQLRYPTHPAPVLSLFFVRSFLARQGGLEAYEAMRLEATRRVAAAGGAEDIRFSAFETVRDAIHAAGGLVLLAHVGLVFPDEHAAQERLIRRMVDAGVDGFELHHPRNRQHARLDLLEALGRELGCVFSGGSDCHHAPGEAPKSIGSCGAPADLIVPLLRRCVNAGGQWKGCRK